MQLTAWLMRVLGPRPVQRQVVAGHPQIPSEARSALADADMCELRASDAVGAQDVTLWIQAERLLWIVGYSRHCFPPAKSPSSPCRDIAS